MLGLGQEMIVPEDDDVTGGQIMIVPEDIDVDAIPDVEGLGGWFKRFKKFRRRKRGRAPQFNLSRLRRLQAQQMKKRQLGLQELARLRRQGAVRQQVARVAPWIGGRITPAIGHPIQTGMKVVPQMAKVVTPGKERARLHRQIADLRAQVAALQRQVALLRRPRAMPPLTITRPDVPISDRERASAQGLGASLYFENASDQGANIQTDGLGASLYFENDAGEGANIKVDGIF